MCVLVSKPKSTVIVCVKWITFFFFCSLCSFAWSAREIRLACLLVCENEIKKNNQNIKRTGSAISKTTINVYWNRLSPMTNEPKKKENNFKSPKAQQFLFLHQTKQKTIVTEVKSKLKTFCLKSKFQKCWYFYAVRQSVNKWYFLVIWIGGSMTT